MNPIKEYVCEIWYVIGMNELFAQQLQRNH